MRQREMSASSRGNWQRRLQNLSSRMDKQNIMLYAIICILLLVIFLVQSGSIESQITESNYKLRRGKPLDILNNSNKLNPLFDKNQIRSFENVILILGKRLLPKGTAPQALKQRVAMAVKVMDDYEFLSFDNTVYIVSGSDGAAFVNQRFDLPTEAEVMYDILVNDHDISKKSILMEPNARDTIENFYFTLTLLKRMGVNTLKGLFIVTSDYHIPRCLQIYHVLNTNRIGYFIDIEKIYDIGSETEWENEEQRIFRFEREAYTMNNSTQYWMSLCLNKWYLFTGGWFPKDNVDVIFDKHCNLIKTSSGEMHQPF